MNTTPDIRPSFGNLEIALDYAKSKNLPLWDTHCNPGRYVVGWETDEPEDAGWTQIEY